MVTLGLREAAAFLRCHPEELRRRAKVGIVPGAKVGRAWVFLEEDLAAYLRSLYQSPRQAAEEILKNKARRYCTEAAASDPSMPLPSADDDYARLLRLPNLKRERNPT